MIDINTKTLGDNDYINKQINHPMLTNSTTAICKYFLSFLCCFILAEGKVFSQSNPEPLFQFGVIADVQYADRPNQGTRHYRASLHKLESAVEVFNQEKVDFVFSLGDLINDGFRSFDTIASITAKLTMPLHHVVGNHDFTVGEVHKMKVLSKLKLKSGYYAFTKKKWRFIVLDGTDISLFANDEGSLDHQKALEILDRLKASGAANAHPWNGTLGTRQLDWLRKLLSKAQKKNQQVVLFCHYPLYPDESGAILWNSPEIRSIIEDYPNIKVWLNGHVHKSQHFKNNDVHYVTFRGMVEGQENAFAIISVYRDHLEISGYGEETDRILK